MLKNILNDYRKRVFDELNIDHSWDSTTYLDAERKTEMDLKALIQRDPSKRLSIADTFISYGSSKAIYIYRISRINGLSNKDRDKLHNYQITNFNVDIHPNAVIGDRFVLDHHFGVIIGETTEIGNDCYILGGTTIGAKGISSNPSGKRHPTIGHNVQIGAFSRIFGDVNIGNDVFISSNSIITNDIQDGMRVITTSTSQYERGVRYEHVSFFKQGNNIYSLGKLENFEIHFYQEFQRAEITPLLIKLLDDNVCKFIFDKKVVGLLINKGNEGKQEIFFYD